MRYEYQYGRTVQDIYDQICELERELTERLLGLAQDALETHYYPVADRYKERNYLPLWARARLVKGTTLEVSWYKQTPWGTDKQRQRKAAIPKPRGTYRIPLGAFQGFPSPAIRAAVERTELQVEPIRKLAARHGKTRRDTFELCRALAAMLNEPFYGKQGDDSGSNFE